ncbi:MAG: DUF1905 domain-containing protein [bacterium]|nr:DUF1905 domain-containing protein [bacterium]
MIYKFNASIYVQSNRAFVDIPFNMWDKTGLKGNIPSKVSILDHSFECKLIPKGSGKYLIPVPKKIHMLLAAQEEYEMSLEPIEMLSRINHNSPYSRKNPVRIIDSIEEINESHCCCGHCCVAMLTGVPLAEIESMMGKSPASWSKIREALDYYGITYAENMIYPKGKKIDLPKCCIVYHDGAFRLWYDGKYYGSVGSSSDRIISCLEIMTPQD